MEILLLYIDVNYKMRLATHPKTIFNPETIRQFGVRDTEALLNFDASIFGGNRRRVLEAFLNKYSNRIFIAINQQTIEGFVIAQDSTIEPFVALSKEIASLLLQAALSLDFQELPRVLIPAKNLNGIEILQNHGFEIEKSLCHMVKGLVPNQQRQHIYGQASYSLG